MQASESMEQTQRNRQAGVLMPVSALPSCEEIGTFGKGAYAFVDWLQSAGMKIWQVLPLLPTGYGDSPYQSCASNAWNYYFIDLETLQNEGLLTPADYPEGYMLSCGADGAVTDERAHRVDYGKLFAEKAGILKKAFARFNRADTAWQAFLSQGEYADFALFMTLKRRFSYAPWTEWDEPFQSCEGQVPQSFLDENQEEIEFWQFTQYLCRKQWKALRAYANAKQIQIMGDMPIYLSADSVEMWKYRRRLFMLDKQGNVALRAGVPPDAFSDEGQLWGNPVYDWQKLKQENYGWWKQRIRAAFDEQFDILRIDHFRAFDRFYAVPQGAETAKEGEWLDGPKAALFQGLEGLPIVAEDLGVIDEGVRKLLKDTAYPGMKVFQFAFDGNPENEYLPSQYNADSVAYTGTHDNDTLRSFIESMEKPDRRAFETALEEECLQADVAYVTESIDEECKTVVELLFASKADRVIIPMQDVCCMGTEARLNAPSTLSQKNWSFRFIQKDFGRRKAAWLKMLTEMYNR